LLTNPSSNRSAEGCFALRDLKKHRHLAGTLFNILFNLNKFIAFETRDPFLVRQARFFASTCPETVDKLQASIRSMLLNH